jgi:regulatory protein
MADNELYKSGLSKAMTMCAGREYCISEVSVKLRSWGITEIDSTRIIEILKQDNFINEERYSMSFVKDKFNYNKWGRIKIASFLKIKNIPGELINKALDSIDNEHYKKTLNDLLSSHKKVVKAKNHYDLKGKLLRYGLSKGFESNLLYDILNEWPEGEKENET